MEGVHNVPPDGVILPRLSLLRSKYPQDVSMEIENAIIFYEQLFNSFKNENALLRQKITDLEARLTDGNNRSSLAPNHDSTEFPYLGAIRRVTQPPPTRTQAQPLSQSQGRSQERSRDVTRQEALNKIIEKSTRTVGIFPVDTDTILAIYQQTTADMSP